MQIMNLINHGMHISFNFLDVDPKYSYILQKSADCPCLIFLTAQWTVFNVAIRWTDKLMTTLLELSLTANWVGIWDHCVPSRIKRKYFSIEKVTCERKVLTSFWGLRGAPERWRVAAALGSTGCTGATRCSAQIPERTVPGLLCEAVVNR